MKRREVIITDEEFRALIGSCCCEEFTDLLTTAWETGARPQELFAVEARHVDLARCRWVFPIEESKGQTLPRVVYLNEHALDITRRLMLKRPSLVFRMLRHTQGRSHAPGIMTQEGPGAKNQLCVGSRSWGSAPPVIY